MLRTIRADSWRRIAIGLAAAIAIVAAVGIVVPAGIGWDFANFYDTGRRVLSWQVGDLYEPASLISGESPQGGMAFWGAPLSALLYAPLGLLSPGGALVAFKVQGTVAFVLALLLLYGENRGFVEEGARWRFAAIFAALVLVFQPFWSVYRVGGQSTPTVFLLVTLAMAGHVRGKPWVTAPCLVAAVAIKPAFVFLLAGLCAVAGWRFLRGAIVSGAVAGAASVLVMGWPVHARFLDVMRAGSQGAYTWEYNSAIYVAADNLMGYAPGAIDQTILGTAVSVLRILMVVLFGWLLSRARGLPGRGRRHLEFLLATCFCLAISRTVWEHYLALLFPLLVYLVASWRSLSSGARAVVAAVFGATLFQNVAFTTLLQPHLSPMSPVGLVLVGLAKAAPLLLSVVFLWRYHREFLGSYRTAAWADAPAGSLA